MPTEIEIQTTGPVVGAIRPPGSKSITNRALICAALAQGRSVLRGALDSEDTQVMIAALRQLGIDHQRLTYRHEGRDYRLTDVAGRVIQEILA